MTRNHGHGIEIDGDAEHCVRNNVAVANLDPNLIAIGSRDPKLINQPSSTKTDHNLIDGDPRFREPRPTTSICCPSRLRSTRASR